MMEFEEQDGTLEIWVDLAGGARMRIAITYEGIIIDEILDDEFARGRAETFEEIAESLI